MKHDVFISFKNSGKDGLPTPDSLHARAVYDALLAAGVKVFFSEESLAEEGRGNFSTSIEMALESARILILVASCREHIESRWVKTEWGSFLDDLRSGNKQGEMFIVNCGNLSLTGLPLFLRSWQMFSANDLNKLVKFVSHAVPPRNSLRDFIKASLHCLQPEKEEDKVYLLTVHPSGNEDNYHVTAYWGARTAKRLKSQIKAVDVSASAAQLEMEKAKREKLRCGYVETSFEKILTREAQLNMSAVVGLHAAPAKTRITRAAGSQTAQPSKEKKSTKSTGITTSRRKAETGVFRAATKPKKVINARSAVTAPNKRALKAKAAVAKVQPKGGSKKTMSAAK